MEDETRSYRRGRRGRPRMHRAIEGSGPWRCFEPCCNIHEKKESIFLYPAEIEAIRLVDLEEMTQEEAAARMGVSRKTIWRDLHDARAKLADALVTGKGIRISGCQNGNTEACSKPASEHQNET